MTTTTKRKIFFVNTTGGKKKWQSEKKKLSALFYPLCVCLLFRHPHFFLSTLAFYESKRKKGRFYTHAHAHRRRTSSQRASSKREREREKKEHGEERGTTLCFVSIQQKRKSKEDFCFKRDDEERSFFFNLLVPGGHPCFERMTMSRVENYNNNNNTLFVAKRESSSVRLLKNSFPSFYRSSSPPRSKEVFVFVLKEKLTKSGVRFIFFFPTTLFHQTEAKNEQTTRRV